MGNNPNGHYHPNQRISSWHDVALYDRQLPGLKVFVLPSRKYGDARRWEHLIFTRRNIPDSMSTSWSR
jgi:hypothetical protein